jgi:hypothetical protein
MQAGPDGAPEFYVGRTASIDTDRTKYYAYPTGTNVPGTITGSTIVWTVPLAAVGNPKAADRLFSVTGFTATSLLPDRPIAVAEPTGSGQLGDEDTLTANQIDAAPSFSYAVRSRGFTTPTRSVPAGTTPGATGNSSGPSGHRSALAATGLATGLPLAGGAVVLLLLTFRRRLRGPQLR